MLDKQILQSHRETAYRVVVETRAPLVALAGDGKKKRIIFEGPHSLFQLGNWTMEAAFSDTRGCQTEFLVLSPTAKEKFSILFQPEADRVEAMSLSGQWRVEGSGVCAVFFSNDAPPFLLTPGAVSAGDALRREADEAIANLVEERKRNETLQNLLTEKLDQYTGGLKEQSNRLKKEVSEKITMLEDVSRNVETLQKEVEDARTQTAAQESQCTALRQELRDMETLEQARHLDVEQLQKKIQSLRERYQDDADTVQLTGGEPFLTGNEIAKAMESAEKQLQDAERLLGQVIKLREKINDNVQIAVLRGAGTLPLDEELGGDDHGGDSGTAESNQQPGT